MVHVKIQELLIFDAQALLPLTEPQPAIKLPVWEFSQRFYILTHASLILLSCSQQRSVNKDVCIKVSAEQPTVNIRNMAACMRFTRRVIKYRRLSTLLDKLLT
jgi:hypothetical protein